MSSNAGNWSELEELCSRLRFWADNAEEQDSTEVAAGLREAANDIEWFADEIVRLYMERKKLRAEIERLTAERDEARRSCCEYAAIVDGADTTEGMESGRFYERAMKYMKDRGWDCFKGDK